MVTDSWAWMRRTFRTATETEKEDWLSGKGESLLILAVSFEDQDHRECLCRPPWMILGIRPRLLQATMREECSSRTVYASAGT